MPGISPALRGVRVIDSHTEGEPTRVIVEGGPDLGTGPLAERVKLFKEQYDNFCSGAVCEPRGSEVVGGALVCEPEDQTAAVRVIFFNDFGYLGCAATDHRPRPGRSRILAASRPAGTSSKLR